MLLSVVPLNNDKEERWNKINQTKGFWANLEWMPGAKRMYQFIEKYDPYILSAASGRDPTSKTGKLKWLRKILTFLSLVSILSSGHRNNSMQRQTENLIF